MTRNAPRRPSRPHLRHASSEAEHHVRGKRRSACLDGGRALFGESTPTECSAWSAIWYAAAEVAQQWSGQLLQ
eukprot:3430291-Prorocentrum_lima.AAC.1